MVDFSLSLEKSLVEKNIGHTDYETFLNVNENLFTLNSVRR